MEMTQVQVNEILEGHGNFINKMIRFIIGSMIRMERN